MSGKGIVLINNETENKQQIKRSQTKKQRIHTVPRLFTSLYLFLLVCIKLSGVSWWLRWKNICSQCRRPRFDPWVRKIPWRRERQPSPVFLPGELYRQTSLVGCSSWGCKGLDKTEWLTVLLLSKLVMNNSFTGILYKNFEATWSQTHSVTLSASFSFT